MAGALQAGAPQRPHWDFDEVEVSVWARLITNEELAMAHRVDTIVQRLQAREIKVEGRDDEGR